ncbi:hypothetical protein HLB42_15370 [Deinococcus sp. D7000]|uniref:Uncharacterized protein n=1 Tax=Deinococcus radiopugnans ATCC 19172 TaxID=585398 RepID=A0ABR6NX83_9DEIO|nr:hypothetical protein [Deinococcus radiopugnans]MBB6018622.1 hypothetical protein [Deinococcus radiopugnans ATCC 19172]QLG12009.1 hypothetical protein HLB42_15370 [Deinococcus sp. D7000]
MAPSLGVVLVLFAVGMVFGVDRRVQTPLVDTLLALQQLIRTLIERC